MTELFITGNCGLYDKLKNLLSARIPLPIEIKRSENGKPYIEGNPLFFSLSHSGGLALIAVSSAPVGVDLELVGGRTRKAVIARFDENERDEILDERDFLRHWTVREAYIKMLGGTLVRNLKSLKYVGGALYDNGEKTDCALICAEGENYVYSLCTKRPLENMPSLTKI